MVVQRKSRIGRWTAPRVLRELKSLADPDAARGMARFGITGATVYGISVTRLPDAQLRRSLPAITRAATDERSYVRKAVNWALRQIGKRNRADALQELTSKAVQRRLGE